MLGEDICNYAYYQYLTFHCKETISLAELRELRAQKMLLAEDSCVIMLALKLVVMLLVLSMTLAGF